MSKNGIGWVNLILTLFWLESYISPVKVLPLLVNIWHDLSWPSESTCVVASRHKHCLPQKLAIHLFQGYVSMTLDFHGFSGLFGARTSFEVSSTIPSCLARCGLSSPFFRGTINGVWNHGSRCELCSTTCSWYFVILFRSPQLRATWNAPNMS